MAFGDYIKSETTQRAMLLAGASEDGTVLPGPAAVQHGQKAVTTAGTQVALAASTGLASGVNVKALVGNSGVIYVGGSAVSSVNGFVLAAGEEVFIEVGNLATVWIDSAVNGEGVSYIGS